MAHSGRFLFHVEGAEFIEDNTLPLPLMHPLDRVNPLGCLHPKGDHGSGDFPGKNAQAQARK